MVRQAIYVWRRRPLHIPRMETSGADRLPPNSDMTAGDSRHRGKAIRDDPRVIKRATVLTEETSAADATDLGALALDWLALDPQPRLICMRGLVLVWANAAAQQELMDGEIALQEGAIVTRERAHQAALEAFVHGCDGHLSTLALPCTDGEGHLLLRGRRIEAMGGEDKGDHVGLAFLRSGARFKAAYADLERAFQLTPAEYRVLSRLIEGLTAEGITMAMGLSVETVRSHIRHIYAKMNVASREAMFARIQPFRL